MKNIYHISESEKKRIIDLYINVNKKSYLVEQPPPPNYTFRGYGGGSGGGGGAGGTWNVTPKTNTQGLCQQAVQQAVQQANKQSVQEKSYTDKYVKEAQRLLGVKDDGKFGPNTLQKIKDLIQKSKTSTPVVAQNVSSISTPVDQIKPQTPQPPSA